MPKRYLQAAQIANAQRAYQTLFNSVLDGIEDPVRQLAMEVQSKTSEEEYDWFQDVPGLARWWDDRPLAKLTAQRMRIPNLDYASGMEVDKNDILDDKLSMVMPRIQKLAQKAGLHPGYLIGQMLINGWDGTIVDESDGFSFDGEFLISAAHPYGKGLTYSNIQTAALAHDSYFTARSTMASYVDMTGRYALGVRGSTLVCGPGLERTALEVLDTSQRNDGSNVQIDNVMKGTAKILISDVLVGSYAAYWALCDLSQPIKPFIFQVRENAKFEAADDPKTDDVFMRRRLKYGASARYGVGYGDPHYIHASNGTT